MGDVGADFFQAFEKLLIVVEQVVEVGGKLVEFVVGATQGHSACQFSIDNRLAGSIDGIYPAEKAST